MDVPLPHPLPNFNRVEQSSTKNCDNAPRRLARVGRACAPPFWKIAAAKCSSQRSQKQQAAQPLLLLVSPSKQVRLVAVQEPASTGGGTESYVYDGSGQRVEKSGPSGTTLYVYDAFR